MNSYDGRMLTIDDLEKDERGSSFNNCTFEETGGGGIIEGINFCYCSFTGCTWNTDADNCNFRGSEGDSIPPRMIISFNEPPEAGVLIKDIYGILLGGDGNVSVFNVKRTDVGKVESILNDNGFSSDEFDITDGRLRHRCGYGSAVMTRDEFLSQTHIELTTDATDDSDPIDGIPDIPADGSSSCTVFIKKMSGHGNYLTGSEHNDQIDLRASRGRLNDLRVNLVNGEAQVTLTSVAETCVSKVHAHSDTIDYEDSEIEIQFAP